MQARGFGVSIMGVPDMCVFCRQRPVAPEWRPFCSERCRLQDLAKWADEAYRIAGDPVREPEAGPKDDGNS